MSQFIERSAFTHNILCSPWEAEPIDEWSALLSTLISSMDVEVHKSTHKFKCEWRHIPLGTTDLNFFSTSGHQTVNHHANKPGLYELLYLHRGPMELMHDGKYMVLDEGQLVLVDNFKNWEINFPEESHCMTMHIKKDWIQRWLAYPDESIAIPLQRDNDWGAPFISSLLSIYHFHKSSKVIGNPQAMADTLGSLAALLLDRGGPENKQKRFQRNQYLELNRFLHQHFMDKDLTAARVAKALNISLRQLHKICKNEDTPFAKSIMEIRLNAARDMLKNPSHRTYQIAEIAWSCGFSDTSHFSRRFKNEFSCTPESYRKTHQESLALTG